MKPNRLTHYKTVHHHIEKRFISRKVVNRIAPVSLFHSADGFFNIAHRGASFYAPENTMPAFQLALDMNADMIELDVTLSRDNVPVVFHDKKLNRTTDGKGLIRDHLLRELRELDAGFWFGNVFRNTQIPTLEEVFEWASGVIAINVEIKKEAVDQHSDYGAVECVNELISAFGMSDQVIISSFSNEALIRFRKISPGIPTAHLMNPNSLGSLKDLRLMKELGAAGINMKHRQMRPNLISRVIDENIPVWIYTIDDEKEMRTVIEKGATGIFTNKPDLLCKIAAATLEGQSK